MTGLQPVIRDAWDQVMQVVEADIAGKPLQHTWQPEVGAAVQGCLYGIPGLPPCPKRGLKSVLHGEDPDADDAGDCDDRQLHQDHRPDAEHQHLGGKDDRQREGCQCTLDRSCPQECGVSQGNRYTTRKTKGGTNTCEISGCRTSLENQRCNGEKARYSLTVRQVGVDVRSLVSAVENFPGGMVLCVVPSPVCVGGKGYQATNPARGIIGGAGGEERAMAAVVLDDERADDEASGREGERERQPDRDVQACVHKGDQSKIRRHSRCELSETSRQNGELIGHQAGQLGPPLLGHLMATHWHSQIPFHKRLLRIPVLVPNSRQESHYSGFALPAGDRLLSRSPDQIVTSPSIGSERALHLRSAIRSRCGRTLLKAGQQLQRFRVATIARFLQSLAGDGAFDALTVGLNLEQHAIAVPARRSGGGNLFSKTHFE